jgi:hypothetical protein
LKTEIPAPIFAEFKRSRETLRIYRGNKCVFKSDKADLSPLMDYISSLKTGSGRVSILDKVMGNAAALLSVKAGASEVYSPLGSELASRTLKENRVEEHLEERVPFILARNGVDMCPMEKLSLYKSPDEFYAALKNNSGKRGQ